ncbi:MAG: hypothetical protein WCA81_05960 [Rhizomicrobium sp.]
MALIGSKALQVIFDQPRSDGTFENQTLQYLREVGEYRSILLLAFAPKAAGTYFRQAAIYAVDGQLVRIAHAQGGRDGTPYLPTVLVCCLDSDAPDTITHIHMQALAANRHFIEAFGLKPIIMNRSIPDMLASFWDMLELDPTARAEGLNCQIPDNFIEQSRAQKADFMVDVIAPWYASYYATWKSFVDDAPETICVLHYKDFCADPTTSLHAALAHAGFFISRAKCSASLDRVWRERSIYRYHKGKQGRGKEYFSSLHVEKLRRLLSYYPQLEPWSPELMGYSEAVLLHQEPAQIFATCIQKVA